MADNQIVVELILDDGQILKAMGRVKQEGDKLKKGLESDQGGGFLSKKIGDITVGMAAVAVAATKAFGLLKDGFTASVSAARESQKAINDLSAALAVNGKFTEGAVAGFERFANTLSKQTGVNDDIITQNASLLVSLGNLSGEGLERATKASLDLASGLGKDVSVGFRMVAQAAEGNFTSLGKYGIKVDESASKSEQFAQALEKLNKKFGGLAEAKAGGFEGQVDRMNNSIDDLLKSFGNIIIKSPVVTAMIKLIADVIGKFADSVTAATKGKDLFGDFIKAAIPVARSINTYLVMPMELFGRAVVTGVSTIATVLLGLSTVVIKVRDFFYENLVKPLGDFFSKILVGLVAFGSEEMAMKLQATLESIGNFANGFVETSSAGVAALYESSIGATIAAANATFETSGSAAIDALLAKAETAAAIAKNSSDHLKKISDENQQAIVDNGLTLGQSFGAIMGGLDTSIKDFAANAQANFSKIGAAMFQTLGQAAGQAFAAFGKAIASGENGLKAFLNSLLASFGQMAIQLGTQFILQGAAYSWAGMPNGPPLIAAGAALAVFGGVLSAIGGGSGAGATAGAGGGGGGLMSSAENPTAGLATPEAPKPQDKITVNIQGDVLDSDETGGRIVRLLTEYSDKNGNGAVVT